MTLVDKLTELGRELGIDYEDNFDKKFDHHKLTGAIDSFSWAVRKSLPQNDLKHLYHYTSQQAAFNIMQSKTLRATDAYFLNDTSEIKHGADALKTALEKLNTVDPSRHERIESAINFLTRPFDEESKDAYATHRGNAYLVSLSTKCDDVSQWQKYAVRHGTSLGFRVDLLSNTVLVNCDGQKVYKNDTVPIEALLAPVIYGNVADLAELVFEDMCSLELGNSFRPQELRVKLVERYACFSSLMKHPSFSSECEWRLLLTQTQVNRKEACWHVGEAYAKPYATLGFAEKGKGWEESDSTQTSSLRRCCKIMINAQDYGLARHYFDFIGVDVSKSNAPLRPQQG